MELGFPPFFCVRHATHETSSTQSHQQEIWETSLNAPNISCHFSSDCSEPGENPTFPPTGHTTLEVLLRRGLHSVLVSWGDDSNLECWLLWELKDDWKEAVGATAPG
jgi:hypothetical protein